MNRIADLNSIIENNYHDVGIGQAIFDDCETPIKRYFLEKRWGNGDKVFGAIMMNPSRATSIKSDKTVNAIVDYAKTRGFDAIYIVNIIPYIDSNSDNLKLMQYNEIKSMVEELTAKKSIIYTLKNSSELLLGWGKIGHDFFKVLLEDKKIRQEFKNNASKCFSVRLDVKGKFPIHPFPKGIVPKDFIQKELILIQEKVIEWSINIH